MKTPFSFISLIVWITFAGLPQAGRAQRIIPEPCAVQPASFSSPHEALYHDLAPARELMEKCEQLRARIHTLTGGPAPRLSEADVLHIEHCRLRMAQMMAQVEAMRQDLARTYPLLSDPGLPTDRLLAASERELARLLGAAEDTGQYARLENH